MDLFTKKTAWRLYAWANPSIQNLFTFVKSDKKCYNPKNATISRNNVFNSLTKLSLHGLKLALVIGLIYVCTPQALAYDNNGTFTVSNVTESNVNHVTFTASGFSTTANNFTYVGLLVCPNGTGGGGCVNYSRNFIDPVIPFVDPVNINSDITDFESQGYPSGEFYYYLIDIPSSTIWFSQAINSPTPTESVLGTSLDPTQQAGITDGIDSLANIAVNTIISVLPHLWLPIGFLLALAVGLGLFFRYVKKH